MISATEAIEKYKALHDILNQIKKNAYDRLYVLNCGINHEYKEFLVSELMNKGYTCKVIPYSRLAGALYFIGRGKVLYTPCENVYLRISWN